MTRTFEYIRLLVDYGDLGELNRLGSQGWHVVATYSDEQRNILLLEREIPVGPQGG